MTTSIYVVTYRLVTPLFCGGARQSSAEVRIQSFKGVLRWWWRALAWSRFAGELAKIKVAEDELFGSTQLGQGKVLMRLVPSKSPIVAKVGEVLNVNGGDFGDGARYLGYGVMEAFERKAKGIKKGQLNQACCQAPFDIVIELRTRNIDDQARALLLDALEAVGLFGGMGAKSRKGYGSVVLCSIVKDGIPCSSPPSSANELSCAIQRLLSKTITAEPGQVSLPLYTALCRHSRVVLVRADGQIHPLALLNRVGREMIRYRSKGRKDPKDGVHKVLGNIESEHRFLDDHELMTSKRNNPTRHPRRSVFGLPHNYNEGKVHPVNFDRRASPLLIHMHEFGTSPVAVLTFLPSQFLPHPDTAKIEVNGKPVSLAPDRELWKPIEDLLDRFLSTSQRQESFGEVLEVRP